MSLFIFHVFLDVVASQDSAYLEDIDNSKDTASDRHLFLSVGNKVFICPVGIISDKILTSAKLADI